MCYYVLKLLNSDKAAIMKDGEFSNEECLFTVSHLCENGEIFDYVDGTNIALTDDPCRTREQGDPNTKWFATGVNVVKGVPKILKIWDRWCLPNQHGIKRHIGRGDQEILHTLLTNGTLHESVVEMPMDYQWLRIQLVRGQDNPNKKIVHWTGPHGKDIIRKKIQK